MKSRGDFKSKLISEQKPSKRRNRPGRSRYRVDLIKLHKDIVAARRQRRPAESTWIQGIFLALAAIAGFFLLGYLIAALSVPIWAKVLFFTFTAILGFVSSYFVAFLFH